jgi:hypothetical protein
MRLIYIFVCDFFLMFVIKSSDPSIPFPQRLGMGGSDGSMARMNISGLFCYFALSVEQH